MKYQIGDKVIHAKYGFGEITNIDDKYIHGRMTHCYVVQTRDLTVWVTADETDGASLRFPTPRNEFEDLFIILNSQGEILPNDRFDRKSELFERMKDGKLNSICEVVRDLSFLRKSKKLNDNDRLTLDRARSFLLVEWGHALSVTQTEAHIRLEQLLGI